MPKQNLQIIGGAYKHPSVPANNQSCINMFPTSSGMGTALDKDNVLNKGRNVACLMRGMGKLSIGTVNDTDINPTCRGIYQLQISVGTYLTVCVMGRKVYNLNFDYTTKTMTPTLLGTLATLKGPVVISSNPTQIMFICYDYDNTVTGGSIYNYVTHTFTNISDIDFKSGSHVIMIDGYFLYNEVGSARFYSSDINNGLSYNALNVATAQSRPDNVIGLGQTKGELWVFGTNSIEVWYDAANATGMPLSKRVGSDIDVGCSAPFSIQTVNDSLIWVDSRRFIVMSDYSQFFRDQSSGYQLTKLSTEAIDAEISSYLTVSDAVASTYNDNGHIMYEITFPSESKTWVFDTTMNMWHERQYQHPDLNIATQSLTNFYVQNEKYILAGSLSNNQIYLVSRDYVDDDGEPIVCKRVTQHVTADFNQIEVSELEVRCNTGLVPIGEDEPHIQLRYSNDSGYTWSDSMQRSLGQTGEYNKRILWGPLGSDIEWLFEFTVTAATKFSINDAAIIGSIGDS